MIEWNSWLQAKQGLPILVRFVKYSGIKMMRSILSRRIFALTMAFLMFISSAGIAIDMHYCGGELKSVSVFGKAKNCHELEDKVPVKACPHHKNMNLEKSGCKEDKDCCSNKTEYYQSDQDLFLQAPIPFQVKEFHQFIVAYTSVFLMPQNRINREILPFDHYRPPLILKDISILIQSFLL